MTGKEPTQVPDIVTIKIMFPVKDEREAWGKRKAILDLLADVPDSKIDMSLTTMPGGISNLLSSKIKGMPPEMRG